jgi:ATP-dependent Lhr-like helicase
MGNTELITQLSSGELVLSIQGERLVSHYTFYSVFMTPEEFRVVYDGKTIGTIPVDSLIVEGQHIVFAGRRWKVEAIDSKKKVITVIITKGGNPPKFSGGGMSVHDRVRQEMLNIYSQGDYRIDVNGDKIDFLDPNAKELFAEGLKHFLDLNLDNIFILSNGENVSILPWKGDKIISTLTMMLISSGFNASCYSGIIEVTKTNIMDVINSLKKFKYENVFTNSKLAELVPNKMTEKYDYLLPSTLLIDGYGVKSFDIKNTLNWLQKHM